jgi:hypothetical protein
MEVGLPFLRVFLRSSSGYASQETVLGYRSSRPLNLAVILSNLRPMTVRYSKKRKHHRGLPGAMEASERRISSAWSLHLNRNSRRRRERQKNPPKQKISCLSSSSGLLYSTRFYYGFSD